MGSNTLFSKPLSPSTHTRAKHVYLDGLASKPPVVQERQLSYTVQQPGRDPTGTTQGATWFRRRSQNLRGMPRRSTPRKSNCKPS